MQTIVNAFARCLSALCLTFGFCQLVGTTSIESCMTLVLFLHLDRVWLSCRGWLSLECLFDIFRVSSTIRPTLNQGSSYFPAAVTLLFSGPKCAPIAVGFHANAVWYVVFWWAFIGGFLDELSSVDLYQIHPPRRPGTIPYRALVPRLSRQMVLVNGRRLASRMERIGNSVPILDQYLFWNLVALRQYLIKPDIRPPRRPWTIPYRALVPRLSRQMSSVMAWDWQSPCQS